MDGRQMFELDILGKLMAHPMHGYFLRGIVGLAIGPIRQLNSSTLYPLIARLMKEGLIQPNEPEELEQTERKRKVYSITQSGRERFFMLMLEPGEYTIDYPDLFNVKLSHFTYLTREQQLSILYHYRGYVFLVRSHLQTNQHHVITNRSIPELIQPHLLRVLNHKMSLVEEDIRWIEVEIARVMNQTEQV